MSETVARPRWIARTLRPNEGQDPLGLQSMTQDRLMPKLLPGILELSDTARYLAFHAFLLDEYRVRRLPANVAALSEFVKSCEWDLGLAVLCCGCGTSPVGMRRLRDAEVDSGVIRRGESVESPLGGYGLYYRSPMVTLGLVARSGTVLGDRPIPVDVLRTTSPRAMRLAAEFRAAVGDTEYVRRYLGTTEPLPVAVVEEYAEQACLCGLAERSDERRAVYDALFDTDPAEGPEPDAPDQGLTQRRRSVAHFLTLIQDSPDVALDQSAYRRAAIHARGAHGSVHELVAGQWAGVMAKDVWQDAVCSLWSDFCRRGLARSRELGRGLADTELRDLLPDLLSGPPRLHPDMPVSELATAVEAGGIALPGSDGDALLLVEADLEDLRLATKRLDSAASGLLVILELARRAALRTDPGWTSVLATDSQWQRPVAAALSGVRRRLHSEETVGETLWWLLARFVISRHETIAYSKLPDFTFRFRWEDGLLRFVDHGMQRFPLASIRHQPLRRLTYDLGLWEDWDAPRLTSHGAALVEQALS